MNVDCIKCGKQYRLDDSIIDEAQLVEETGKRRMIGLRRNVYVRYEHCMLEGIMAVKSQQGNVCPVCAAEFFMVHAHRLTEMAEKLVAGSGFGEPDNFEVIGDV